MSPSIAFVCCLLFPSIGTSHELWIDSQQFQVEKAQEFVGELKNGENFEGIRLPFFERQFEQLSYDISELSPVLGRDGDLPAIRIQPETEGLMRVIYQSRKKTVTYRGMEKFTNFVKHKDLAWALDRHLENAWPQDRFDEEYYRHSKALVAVGDAQGEDKVYGLRAEITALDNPYTTPNTQGLRLLLTEFSNPIPNGQIEVFERDKGGNVTVSLLKTDQNGVVTLPIKAGHDYLLDHVILTELNPAENTSIYWRSDWAALTFSVPE